MSEKRFVYGIINGSRQAHLKDCHNCKSATIDVYDDDFNYFVDLLNNQAETIKTQQVRIYCQDKEIQKLQKQLTKIPPKIKEVWLE